MLLKQAIVFREMKLDHDLVDGQTWGITHALFPKANPPLDWRGVCTPEMNKQLHFRGKS